MKAKELKVDDLFRFGKQKKYRRVRSNKLLECWNTVSQQYQDKQVIMYDNCKRIVVDPDLEVEVSEYCAITNFGRQYCTGKEKFDVYILNFKTQISFFLKDMIPAIWIYAIRNTDGVFVDLDIRKVASKPFDDDVFYICDPQTRINAIIKDILKRPHKYLDFIQ